jgi:ATP-dependent DNA helicase PIF1
MSFYAVAKGRAIGIYEDWNAAKDQVSEFPGALYKVFKTREEADAFIALHSICEKINAIDPTFEPKFDSSRLDTLTHEQRSVFDALMAGKSGALLGPAGVGKSYLLSIIYTELAQMRLCQVQLCAMTGCAALLLGNKAKTLHSWAGIGLGKDDVDTLCARISKNGRAKKNWKTTDLLIIDEISMATPDLLDKLNAIGKRMRRSSKPFGGIQVLFVGDFYQLPPVSKGATTFAFESAAWAETVQCIMELTIIQRQKDPVFQTILNEARIGSFSLLSCKILESCKRDWQANKIKPTLIFPRRAEVDAINEANLNALKEEVLTYKAKFTYNKEKTPPDFKEKSELFQTAVSMLDTDAPYQVELVLRIGAQVMLSVNLDSDMGLVNGSRGVIVDVCAATKLPVVEFVNGIKRVIAWHDWVIEGFPFVSRSQVPLRLSYAITIHRSQGSTLDCALVDVGLGTFEYGQAYVALSRVTSLEALYIYDFDARAFRVHPKVKEFYKLISANLALLAQESLVAESLVAASLVSESLVTASLVAESASLVAESASLETLSLAQNNSADSSASKP